MRYFLLSAAILVVVCGTPYNQDSLKESERQPLAMPSLNRVPRTLDSLKEQSADDIKLNEIKNTLREKRSDDAFNQEDIIEDIEESSELEENSSDDDGGDVKREIPDNEEKLDEEIVEDEGTEEKLNEDHRHQREAEGKEKVELDEDMKQFAITLGKVFVDSGASKVLNKTETPEQE